VGAGIGSVGEAGKGKFSPGQTRADPASSR